MHSAHLVLFLLVFCLISRPSELIESDNIWTAVKKAEDLSKKYGPNHVVFASDLDNTLLKTKQDLSSEPWFNWQEGLLKETNNEYRVACNFQDLLHLFYIAIGLSQATPVQEDQAQAISYLQNLKISTMAITARGEAVASQTFRELLKSQINFSKTSLNGDGYPASHNPFEIKNPEAFGLTQADVEKFKLAEPRPVLYQRGVLFSDGQNKGVLLRTLFHKINRNIKGLVFFDNDKKNTQRVFDVFEGHDVEVASIRATRMDADIARFNTSDKEKVTEDFVLLRRFLDKAYLYPRPCTLPVDLRVNAH